MENVLSALPIPFDAEILRSRLRERISKSEFFGLTLGLCLLFGFTWFTFTAPDKVMPHDFSIYFDAGRGNIHDFYYGFWVLPIFTALARLPFSISYCIWGIITIASVFFAARVFSGRAVFAVFTYQFFSNIYLGQISGLTVGGLALFWWAAANKKWFLAGLGLLIAAAKVQTGIIFGGLLFLLVPIAFRDRIKILLVPLTGALLSLVLYPGWPLDMLAVMKTNPPNDLSSISLWQWIGPAALLLYGAALALPGTMKTRMYAFMILTPLAFPYFQEYDLLILFCLPFGAWVLLGNLGFLYIWYSWNALKALMIVPIIFYIAFSAPIIIGGYREFRKRFVPSHE